MEKRIILNNMKTPFIIEDTGRLYNEKTQRWLKGGINKGVHFYNIYFKGKQYTLYTHRIVAQYFLDNPHNYSFVIHIDGNNLNNIYTNLAYVAQNELTEKARKSVKKQRERQTHIENYVLEDMAQFRNSPYYATKDGNIINVSKNIIIKFEKSGNYLRFVGNYNLNKKHFLVHRVVWESFNGLIPKGYDIDHINGDPHDNRLENLRLLTHQENIKARNMDYSYAKYNFPHFKNK